MEIGVYFLAMMSPLLYATTNHIDKILLEQYFKEGGVGTLILFSALLSIIALPVLFVIDSSVLAVSWQNLLLLICVGCLNVLLLWCYLQAMFTDEPTVVIIFYQLVPVIGLVLGYLILGETIDASQGLAMVAILAGALILTVAQDADGKVVVRYRTAVYMLIASSCWAFETVLFKLVALEENLWRSLFWEHVVLVFIGVIIFSVVPRYRQTFVAAWKKNSSSVLALNGLNESLYIIGNSVAAYVVLLVPVTITLLMNSFQPLFVLLLGLALHTVAPTLAVENVTRRHLIQKVVAITVTGYGAYQLGEW